MNLSRRYISLIVGRLENVDVSPLSKFNLLSLPYIFQCIFQPEGAPSNRGIH